MTELKLIMKKEILKVPKGIRYLSEWKEFSLPIIPTIIDKQLTGCGFTEYCISCQQDIIVCSPRVILLENKASQHPGELMYVKNDLETVLNVDNTTTYSCDNSKEIDAMLTKVASETSRTKEEETADYYQRLRFSIRNYYLERKSRNLPCKFIVTYDSFRHVKEAMIECGVYEDFYVVVDEFQSIFTDSRFKSTTEIGFLRQLEGTEKLCYVSATPMIDKYLEKLDWFKDLNYEQFDWESEDPGRVFIPDIDAKPTNSVISSAKSIINDYLSGNFQKYTYKDESGKIIEIPSTEVVIYVNSVKNICDLIKRCGLTLDNTNVLCSRTADNNSKVKKAFGIKRGGPKEVLGHVPVKGEPHKMFTLCTRTVYLGADFYSTCARSIVLSDSNVDCLAVDITLDLPQIMGRQRLDENPWKNRIELFFKSTRADKKKTIEEFSKLIENKQIESEKLLQAFDHIPENTKDAVAKKYEDSAVLKKYLEDYIAVDIKTGVLTPVFNELVLLADIRAFEVQQVDYRDLFTVFSTLKDSDKLALTGLSELILTFNSLTNFQDKMKFICSIEDPCIVEGLLNQVPIEFRNYYYVIGPQKLKALEYRRKEILKEYTKLYALQTKQVDISSVVYEKFAIGGKYKRSDIKSIFRDIFELFSISESPKAKLLENYFDIKPVLINDPITKKRDPGFEIIKKKE